MMRDQTYFNGIAAVAVVVVLVATAVTLVASPAASTPSRSPGPGPSGATVYRSLSISPDRVMGGFSYSTLALSVPLNVRVVFTITNFDPTTGTLPTAIDAQVAGTESGSAQVISSAGTYSVARFPSTGVSHTFSLSDGSYHLNVPIPPAQGPSSSVQVTFSAVFTARGTFEWGCVILCGAAGMGAPDAMYGSLTVS